MAKKATKKSSKKTTKKASEKEKAAKPMQQVGKDFTIKDEFRNLLPPLNTADLRKLKRSILKDGCREKLTVWKEENVLIDGHHRYDICDKHKRPYEVVRKSFKSKDEAITWVLDNQKGRRNMNKFQWAEVVLNSKSSIAAVAKEGQRRKGVEGYQKSDKVAVHTLKVMANLAGMSHDTLHKVETILSEADTNPDNERLQRQVDKLRKGEPGISINSVYEAVQEAKGKKKVKASRQTIPLSKAKRAVFRDVATQIKSVLSALDDVASDGTKIENSTSLYDKIIEWANAKKADLDEPQK